MANLIVNYIPQDITEEQLQQLFLPYGNIESVKIVKEKMTQRSLGYGFVKYQTVEEGKAAIDALNGRQLENKTLKVSVAKPPGNEKLSNLYVAGLEPTITKDDLHTLFQAYGNISETKILVDKNTGSARGVGFIKFESAEEAADAIKALHGVTLAGTSKPLTVRVADKKDNKTPQAPMAPQGAPFGRNMRYNPMAYYQQGYQMPAYSQFAGYPPQQMQMPPMQMHMQDPSGGMATYCLFVYNLPPESDENYLYQLFGPYGSIMQVKIARDPSTNLCKGFGFVNMIKLEDAQTAISALNGAQIGTKTLQVSFKKDKH